VRNTRRLAFLLTGGAAAALFVACGDSSKSTPAASGTPTAGAPGAATATAPAVPTSKYALSADPKDAISVVEARKAAPKPTVVVFGRVREITAGFAAFTMADTSLKFCGEGEAEKETCETPWDYCCLAPEEIASHTIAVVVKEAGKDGKSDVAALAKIPELRNLDLVAVVGTLVKDKGDVTLEATGWYRRERPVLGANAKVPQ
jgi:hypothetical protein